MSAKDYLFHELVFVIYNYMYYIIRRITNILLYMVICHIHWKLAICDINYGVNKSTFLTEINVLRLKNANEPPGEGGSSGFGMMELEGAAIRPGCKQDAKRRVFK